MAEMTRLTFHDIFAVTELAECILLELPIQEILITAQRVSKQWKDIIDCSPRLQQALFFQPLPETLLQLHHNNNSYPPQSYFAESRDSKPHILVVGNPFIERINVSRYGRQEYRIKRPEASWRRMLVSQPGLSVISFPRLPQHNGNQVDMSPHQIVREEGVLMRQALFEDAHIKQGFSGVATEMLHFSKVKMAWEVRRVEE